MEDIYENLNKLLYLTLFNLHHRKSNQTVLIIYAI